MISTIIFAVLAFFAIVGALVMLFYKNPIYCALGLLICILAIAGLFALLSAPFLFMAQIIVYAGAIMTLFLFILMFLNIQEEHLPKEPSKNLMILIGIILMIPIDLLILKAISKLPNASMQITNDGFGSLKNIGLNLYVNWLFPFELISILLLVALVGAIVLAKKNKRGNK